VRVSTRLTESACCLVAADSGLDRQLARLLAEHGREGMSGRAILEINAKHPAVTALAEMLADRGADAASDRMFLLLDLARVTDGEPPVDAAAFGKRLAALIARGP
jgi:molecular chaperone HtpG